MEASNDLTTVTTAPRSSLANFATALSLVALIGLAAAGWQAFHQHQQLQTLQQQVQHQQTQLAKEQQVSQQLQLQLNQNQVLLKQVLSPSTTAEQQYLLTKINYLFQQAQLHLEFDHNINAAISLLNMANAYLAHTQAASLLKLRQALAQDILQLQAIHQPDISGILSQLAALTKQTEQLAIFEIPKPKGPQEPQANQLQTVPRSAADWKTALLSAWHSLQKLIIIRHHQQMIEPLLPAEQELYLRQNLQLTLQRAQMAVLQRQAEVYQQSLIQASDWIAHYFVTNQSATQAALASIKQLQQQDIAPAMPHLSLSWQALQQASALTPGEEL